MTSSPLGVLLIQHLVQHSASGVATEMVLSNPIEEEWFCVWTVEATCTYKAVAGENWQLHHRGTPYPLWFDEDVDKDDGISGDGDDGDSICDDDFLPECEVLL